MPPAWLLRAETSLAAKVEPYIAASMTSMFEIFLTWEGNGKLRLDYSKATAFIADPKIQSGGVDKRGGGIGVTTASGCRKRRADENKRGGQHTQP